VNGISLVVRLVIVALCLVGGFLGQRRRRVRVIAWAAANGWTYQGSAPALTRRWQGAPFGVGNSRGATELLTGTWQGRPATSFFYHYSVVNGRSRSAFTFQVLALGLPVCLPTLELTPEGLGDRIAKAFGGQDLEFESADFNSAWRVTSGVPRFASDVVHPRLMELLLRPDARANLRIEGTDILTWSPGAPDLDLIASRLGLLDAVVRSIPRFVWLECGHDPGSATGPDRET
jgi:hypothetical protein